MRLPREERQQLVAMLAGEGMSTRAIAPIVGVSIGTVHSDQQVFNSEHPKSSPDTFDSDAAEAGTDM